MRRRHRRSASRSSRLNGSEKPFARKSDGSRSSNVRSRRSVNVKFNVNESKLPA